MDKKNYFLHWKKQNSCHDDCAKHIVFVFIHTNNKFDNQWHFVGWTLDIIIWKGNSKKKNFKCQILPIKCTICFVKSLLLLLY